WNTRRGSSTTSCASIPPRAPRPSSLPRPSCNPWPWRATAACSSSPLRRTQPAWRCFGWTRPPAPRPNYSKSPSSTLSTSAALPPPPRGTPVGAVRQHRALRSRLGRRDRPRSPGRRAIPGRGERRQRALHRHCAGLNQRGAVSVGPVHRHRDQTTRKALRLQSLHPQHCPLPLVEHPSGQFDNIVRFDPASGAETVLAPPAVVQSLAVASDGSVLFIAIAPDSTSVALFRLDPSTGTETKLLEKPFVYSL